MTINQLTGTECGTEIAKIINRLISEKSDTDLGNLSATGQAILDGKSSISLDNLSAAGQAILDKKVEVEALLQQNGYAKFTWKENNQISNLIVQWGTAHRTTPVVYPISFSDSSSYAFVMSFEGGGSVVWREICTYTDKTASQINVGTNGYMWIAIGY